jgi:thiamine pyrophosphate-dependent acetolactate synthase large subunit-like protein
VLVGDDSFMMLMAEFATAVQYNLLNVIILKNNALRMIRWEQTPVMAHLFLLYFY